MLVIGHRGAMGEEPENTLRGFERAIQDGVDAVEMDVHLLKDGELVVIHDNTLDRTTNGHGFVSEQTLADIKKLDAGLGEKVSTLREVLDYIDRRVSVIIEMAGNLSSSETVAAIIKEYVTEKQWQYNQFKVVSFIHHELAKFRAILPQVEIGVNISATPITYAKFTEDITPDFVASEDLYLADDKFVRDTHERGMKFYMYSVNYPDYLPRYKNFGIDGFYTNNPRLFKERKF